MSSLVPRGAASGPASFLEIHARLTQPLRWDGAALSFVLAGPDGLGAADGVPEAWFEDRTVPPDQTFAYGVQVRAALSMATSVADLDLLETTDVGAAEIVLMSGAEPSGGGHAGLAAFQRDDGSPVAIGVVGSAGGAFHTVGHVLGLRDLWRSVADRSASEVLGPLLDGPRGSVMTAGGISTDEAASFSTFDIAALQALYGAADHARADSIYRLKPDGPLDRAENAVGISDHLYAIWDSAGSDRIDASLMSVAVTLDLNPATLDRVDAGPMPQAYATLAAAGVIAPVGADARAVGGLSGVTGSATGYSIANGVRIEAATGGSGDDILIGGAEVDTLMGGAGNDTIAGGAGGDDIAGDDGDDVLWGDDGDDTLRGGDGDDVLYGDSIYDGDPGKVATLTMGSGAVDPDDRIAVPASIDAGALAVRLDAGFSDQANDAIERSQSMPHSSWSDTGDGSIAHGAFTLDGSARIVLDVDATSRFDAFLTLYRADGSIVATADDGFLDKGSTGSEAFDYTTDSRLASVLSAGDYVVALGALDHADGAVVPIPAGAAFTLHLSVAPGSGEDVPERRPGDDLLHGGPGNDVLDGGAGRDLAEFDGDFVGFRATPDGLWVEADGIDVLRDVEDMTFADADGRILTRGDEITAIVADYAGTIYMSYTTGWHGFDDVLL